MKKLLITFLNLSIFLSACGADDVQDNPFGDSGSEYFQDSNGQSDRTDHSETLNTPE